MKKLFSVFVAICIILSLSACSFGDAEESASKEPSKTQSINNTENTKDTSPSPDAKKEYKLGETASDSVWKISLLEARQYTEVKSEYFTDTPDEGNVYLVLFFEAENISDEDDYINYYNLTSYVNDYAVSTDMILGDVNGCSALASDVAVGKKHKGFVSFQVPSDWTKFETSYQTNFVSKTKIGPFVITPSDLAK